MFIAVRVLEEPETYRFPQSPSAFALNLGAKLQSPLRAPRTLGVYAS